MAAPSVAEWLLCPLEFSLVISRSSEGKTEGGGDEVPCLQPQREQVETGSG